MPQTEAPPHFNTPANPPPRATAFSPARQSPSSPLARRLLRLARERIDDHLSHAQLLLLRAGPGEVRRDPHRDVRRRHPPPRRQPARRGRHHPTQGVDRPRAHPPSSSRLSRSHAGTAGCTAAGWGGEVLSLARKVGADLRAPQRLSLRTAHNPPPIPSGACAGLRRSPGLSPPAGLIGPSQRPSPPPPFDHPRRPSQGSSPQR